MAKKNKKFKKKVNQNLSERIAQIQIEEKAANPVATTVENSNVAPDVVVKAEDKYAYVRKDIRRDSLIILFLILLLVGVTVLNTKTSHLKDFADWIYTILNLKV